MPFNLLSSFSFSYSSGQAPKRRIVRWLADGRGESLDLPAAPAEGGRGFSVLILHMEEQHTVVARTCSRSSSSAHPARVARRQNNIMSYRSELFLAVRVYLEAKKSRFARNPFNEMAPLPHGEKGFGRQTKKLGVRLCSKEWSLVFAVPRDKIFMSPHLQQNIFVCSFPFSREYMVYQVLRRNSRIEGAFPEEKKAPFLLP